MMRASSESGSEPSTPTAVQSEGRNGSCNGAAGKMWAISSSLRNSFTGSAGRLVDSQAGTSPQTPPGSAKLRRWEAAAPPPPLTLVEAVMGKMLGPDSKSRFHASTILSEFQSVSRSSSSLSEDMLATPLMPPSDLGPGSSCTSG